MPDTLDSPRRGGARGAASTARRYEPSSLTARRFELNGRLKADERFICADVAAGFEEDDGAYDPDGLHLRKGGYAKLAKLAYPALRQAQRTKGTARAPKPD